MDFYDKLPSLRAVEDMAAKYHKQNAEVLKKRAVNAQQNQPETAPQPGAQPGDATAAPPVAPYIPPQSGAAIGTDEEPAGYNGPQSYCAQPYDYINFGRYNNFDCAYDGCCPNGGCGPCRDNCGCNDGYNGCDPCNNYGCGGTYYNNCGCRLRRRCWRVSPRAVRLCQEIIDRMKDVRAIFIMLDRQGYVGYTRDFNSLIAEKTANIHIMERVYECLTGYRPLDYTADYYYVRGFCAGLRQAFLEQSAIIDKIGALNRLVPDPALSRTITSVGASELKSLGEINRLYARCQ